MHMKLMGPLIAVKDELVSRAFYEEVLDQKLKVDLGACQQFTSGLTLLRVSHMTELYQVPQDQIYMNSNSSVIYFETEDLDEVVRRLAARPDIKYVHSVIEFEWGQRSVTFYDPDGHVVDVADTMELVCRKLYDSGMSLAEVAERIEHPLEFVEKAINERPK